MIAGIADIIRALTDMVERVGAASAIAVAIAVLCVIVTIAAAYVIKWNNRLVDKLVETQENSVALSTNTVERNTVSMNANTESNLKIVAILNKREETDQQFTKRVARLIKELNKMREHIGNQLPDVMEKIDAMIATIHTQVEILKQWPSDPEKICQAAKTMLLVEQLLDRLDKKPEPQPTTTGNEQ